MSEVEHRKLTAIRFTDMVGYSALNLELIKGHRRLQHAISPQR